MEIKISLEWFALSQESDLCHDVFLLGIAMRSPLLGGRSLWAVVGEIDMCNVTSARGMFNLIIYRLTEPALAVDFDAAYFFETSCQHIPRVNMWGQYRSRDIPRRSGNND